MIGQWLILIVTVWKWVLLMNLYKIQCVDEGNKALTNCMGNLLFCYAIVLDI